MDNGGGSSEVALLDIKGGFKAIIDKADYTHLSSFSWLLHRKPNGYIKVYRYERRRNGKYKRVSLVHTIMGKARQGYGWDHRDGNTLNNQRSNLREATQRQNMQNARVRKIRNRIRPKSSQYKGVSHSLVHKRNTLTKPWRCRIRVNGELINIGWFMTENEAAIAYNIAAKKYFGEFASLNEVRP